MQSSVITAISARICRSTLLALAMAGGVGCAAPAPQEFIDDAAQTDAEIAAAQEALTKGRVGGGGLGFSCDAATGECSCSKEIENDCEAMSGVCSDDSIDNLIRCIEGWLTTDCTCTLARVAPPKPKVRFAVEIGAADTALLAR